MQSRQINAQEILERFNSAPPIEPPLAEHFRTIAERMLQELLNDTKMGTLEAAGRLAGVALLHKYADGELTGKSATIFLRELFKTKTPAPIQRVETETKTDMRVLMAEAINQNPAILEASIAKAMEGRQAIQERLSLPPTLELQEVDESTSPTHDISQPLEATPVASDESLDNQSPNWQPGDEPDEIKKLRDPDIGTPEPYHGSITKLDI